MHLIFIAFRILTFVIYFVIQVKSWHALVDAPESNTTETLPLGPTHFSIYRKRMSWSEARFECEKTSSRLAVLPKLEDALNLVGQIKSMSTPFSEEYDHAVKKYEYGMDRRYWIGLTDLPLEGDWTWMSDGSKLAYDYWYANQPDHIRNGIKEDCVLLWNPGYHLGDNHTFNDESCLHKHYFICEKVSKATVPPVAAAPPVNNTIINPPAVNNSAINPPSVANSSAIANASNLPASAAAVNASTSTSAPVNGTHVGP